MLPPNKKFSTHNHNKSIKKINTDHPNTIIAVIKIRERAIKPTAQKNYHK